MICPRCSVAEISPETGACELCAYVPGGVAVETPRPDPLDELARAQLAHQFRIDALLGRGDGSLVYLAREQDSEQHIVVKVLARAPGRPDVESRFRDAVVAASALEHPHLVPILRHGVTDSLLWYSMEHRRARSLREILRTGGVLETRTTMRVATQIAGALDYLHRRGVIHGRLKPENVLVDAEQWVHVCDAIVARAIQVAPPSPPSPPSPPALPARPSTSPAVPPAKAVPPGRKSKANQEPAPTPSPVPAPAPVVPSSMYLSPEESGNALVGHAADQFALAMLIHECLTGELPKRDATTGALTPTFETTRSDLPVHIGHAIARALSARPMNRYPSVLDFVTALESGSSMMVDARPSGRGSGVVLQIHDWKAPPRVPPRWLKAALFTGAVLGIGGGALALIQHTNRSDEAAAMAPVTTLQPSPASGDSTSPVIQPPAGSTSVSPTPLSSQSRGDRPGAPRAGDFSQRGHTTRRGRGEDSARTRSRSASATPSVPPAAASPSPGAPAPVPASAPAPSANAAAPAPAGDIGKLFVNATPWGQVFVDGRAMGNTPKANLPVAPGTHVIRVSREGYDTVERTVTVAAGETVRLTNLVLTPRP